MDPCPNPRPGHLHGYAPGYETITHVPCGKWTCPRCALSKRFKFARRLENAKYQRLLTLTHAPKEGESPEQALRRMRSNLGKLLKRLERRYGGHRIGYTAVVEWTKAGWPHIHLVADMPFLRQRDLSRMWRDLQSAPIVDIRRAKPGKGSADYLAKYLSKSTAMPPRMRRWSCSRGHLPPLPPYHNPDYTDDLKWTYNRDAQSTILRWAAIRGYSAIRNKDTIILIPPAHQVLATMATPLRRP